GDIALGVLLAVTDVPSSIVPGIPRALDDVVSRALARDRNERFQTALEFQEALERAIPPAQARDVARVAESAGREGFELRRAALQERMEGRENPPSTIREPSSRLATDTSEITSELPAGAVKPGELFADKYRIESVIGLGGMGYVLAARHIHLNERVAIK